MIENELPFGKRTAQMLMAVANDPRLTTAKHASRLPPHWYTLYELRQLSDAQFEAAIANGLINPEMERDDARSLRVIEHEPEPKDEEDDGPGETPEPQRRRGGMKPCDPTDPRSLVSVKTHIKEDMKFFKETMTREDFLALTVWIKEQRKW
jgi:hypothetical protein